MHIRILYACVCGSISGCSVDIGSVLSGSASPPTQNTQMKHVDISLSLSLSGSLSVSLYLWLWSARMILDYKVFYTSDVRSTFISITRAHTEHNNTTPSAAATSIK